MVLLIGAALLAVGIGGCLFWSDDSKQAEDSEQTVAATDDPDAPPTADEMAASVANPPRVDSSAVETAPLERVWISPSYDERKYSEIFVAPVDTRQIAQLKPIQEVNPVAFDQSHGALQAAAYARDSFARAVAEFPRHHFTMVERPGPRTLVVYMAITALAPNRIGVGPADYAGPVLGAPAALNATSLPGRGWMEMQTSLRDGATGEVMVVVSDARSPAAALANPARLKPYGFTDGIMDQWTHEILSVIANPPAP
jgi:nitrogen fixation-related uncharacterized protein